MERENPGDPAAGNPLPFQEGTRPKSGRTDLLKWSVRRVTTEEDFGPKAELPPGPLFPLHGGRLTPVPSRAN